MKEFNKRLCLSNIYYLAKKKNIKIGDLESAAGVSAGYISRLNKADTKTSPSIEMLVAVADMLEVSLDALLHHDFEVLTPGEKYMVDFLSKLIEKTTDNDEIWQRETYSKLSHIRADENGNPNHPLFSWQSKFTPGIGGYPEEQSFIGYNSLFREEERVSVCDDGYILPFGDQSLYLMKVIVPTEMDGQGNDAEYEYELYMVDRRWNVSIVCHSTYEEDSPYNQPLADLYGAAADSSKHPILTASVRSAIDNYMSAADLPF